jgi:hypothetical protein
MFKTSTRCPTINRYIKKWCLDELMDSGLDCHSTTRMVWIGSNNIFALKRTRNNQLSSSLGAAESCLLHTKNESFYIH